MHFPINDAGSAISFFIVCGGDVTVLRSLWGFLRGRKKWIGLLWDVSAVSLPF